ncbi:MAG: DHH family phosphoesterase [Candidatus Liptonbacteria bacterium]|nr:DHH family phosphoesterase [Candidatus Liptonbacteria bacterium]
MSGKDIVILYHGGCPDGFGGAYAAWKKFGDSAEYLPASYGDPLPEELAGREVYLVDFCYESSEQIDELVKMTKRLVVLDHHESNKAAVEHAPEHVYDANRAGATIAWSYFHPESPTPRLMTYLEDGDLYHYSLPETRDIFSYLLMLPFDFQKWDEFVRGLEDDATRAKLLAKARAYTEFFEALAQMSIERAKKVRFEGYEVYFASTHPNITMRSYVGNQLYMKLPPFAIIATAHPNGFGVSLRGDGSVDVSKIAAKYGGGGHPGSAGFFIPYGTPPPWNEIEEK